MRHLFLALPSLALLVSGCDRKPEDPVFVYGKLMHADGSPRADTPLPLERKIHIRSGRPPTEAENPFVLYAEQRSERSGHFTMEVLKGDAQDTQFNEFVDYRFRVSAPLEEGHGVYASFTFDDDVELPPMRTWEPHLVVRQEAEGPALSFDAAPPPPELPPSGRLMELYREGADPVPLAPTTPVPVLQLRGEGGLVWEAHDPGSPWRPSPYVLEDFEGVEAQVRAVTLGTWTFEPLGAGNSGVAFRVEWRGPRVPVAPGQLRPVSRGVACTPSWGEGACPYTDGSLARVKLNPAPDDANPGARELVLYWETPVKPRRIVLRDLEVLTLGDEPRMLVVLEGSLDGYSWTPLADVLYENHDERDPSWDILRMTVDQTEKDSPYGDERLDLVRKARFLDVPLSGTVSVRHVRLTLFEEDRRYFGLLYSLSEFSVFE
ncbi:hypothetical protein LZ198_27835 [Myxococcus sp. K15C18031901]|uniref:hypothetical protein n=1 Tax=Myxococcus dinghuensis TaxID=2906761 RepID=UPI0020A74B7C|nr:hypothetical protein [Myxococcus dinghuensis]MCP3102692.1 hypothetical protein [Myxococcus dinghuensis]